MTTIETTASVTADHRLVVDTTAPAELSPGEHRVVVMIQPQAATKAAEGPLFQPHPVGPIPTDKGPLTFSNYPVGPVSSDITFSRRVV